MPLKDWLHRRSADKTHVKPFVIPPSQSWDGNDGSWSTFNIRVGDPAQTFRVLPATSGDETWVPIPLGCESSSLKNPPSDCGNLRGANPFQVKPSQGFDSNASTTWQKNGIFNLLMEENLGEYANGGYGFDTVGLGSDPSGLTLNHQVVAGVADKAYWLGVFGLGPKPANFTAAVPSFMTNLADQKLIPSLSYGYTAGAKYRDEGSLASLVIGGHDNARHTSNTLTFGFDSDDSRSLTVGLQSIVATRTLQGTVIPLSAPGIYTLIDSGVPDIWLPEPVCEALESAFGLIYDSTTHRYLVNDTTHSYLQQLNPSIAFQLGQDATGGFSFSIELPYAAFDLQASYPIYPNATNYFPIRRASNSTQYTIGRAFLQEAYITVHYEESTFNVYQATPSKPGVSDIVAIKSLDTPNSSSHSHSLGSAAIAGITVVNVAIISLIGAFTFLYLRRRRKQRRTSKSSSNTTNVASDHPTGELKDLSGFLSPNSQSSDTLGKHPAFKSAETAPAPPRYQATELESPAMITTGTRSSSNGSRRNHELVGSAAAGELDGKRNAVYELPADDGWMAELPHSNRRASGATRPRARKDDYDVGLGDSGHASKPRGDQGW